MNAVGIALTWCIVQITLLSLLAAGLYLLVRRLRPAAAASVVLSSLAIVVILSVLALSPWPRWTIAIAASSTDTDVSDARSAEEPETTPSAAAPASAKGPNSASPDSVVQGDDPWESAAKSPAVPGEKRTEKTPAPKDDRQVAATKSATPKTQSSSASLVWQSLMAELSYSQNEDTWRWPAVVAIVLLGAMSCGLAWLVLGMAAVRWQRMRSRTLDDNALLEAIDVLRAELGCLRAIEVRESDDLVTAATIGWRQPVVLLPADWRTWTPEQCRAVLAHEIVHARSHDFVALLFGQLGLMLHYYHPLLHWLMNRLRLEQELAADAAAASISGGPRQYLSTIAEIALRGQDRSLSWPARTFLPTRNTFLRRIAVLRDNQVRFDRLSPAARWTLVGTVLLFGVLVAGLRGPVQLSQAAGGQGAPPPPPPPPATAGVVPAAPQQAAPTAPQQIAPAAPQQAEKLRYGCKKGDKYCYTVKIAATMPDEERTHQGTLTYDVLSATDDQFTLKSYGNLHMSSKPKPDASGGFGGPRIPGPPGMFGPPRIPMPPAFFGPGAQPIRPEETTFDRQGKIIRHGENPFLPLLLGRQTELVVEQLADDARTAWTVEHDLGVIEHNEAAGPPFFSPFRRAGTETNRGAKERIDYAVVGQDQDAVRISRKYSLKTAPEQGITHIDMSGDGEITFDRKLGVIKSERMKYDVRINEQNVVVTIPFTMECKLLSDAEAAELKKKQEEQLAKLKERMAAAEEANKPKSLARGEKQVLLARLRSHDEQVIQKAAKRLSKAIPDDDNPSEFSRPLCAAYKNKNEWTQAEVMAALRVWAGPDAEKTVIEASRHSSFMVRGHAIPALGKFKTVAAAEAAAAQASQNRGEVEAAMKAMGRVAEPAAITLLENADFWIRGTAANILAEIGGKKGLAALAKEARLHPNQVHQVETAIVAIEKRLAESGSAADAEPKDDQSAAAKTDKEEKADGSVDAALHTWRAAAGGYTVQAAFVELSGGKVTLKKADGRTVKVPLEKLSKADQDYAKQQAEAAKNKPEDPFQ
jgi:beta-lactamase regulating signal transducer with metallopeptidase domain